MLSRAVDQVGGGMPGGQRRLVFIAGIALAVLAFALMLGFGLAAAGQNGSGAQVDVVVAAKDIGQREQLTDDALTISRMSQSAVPPAALNRIADAHGTVALINIIKGQPITTNMVARSTDEIAGSSSAYLPIPQGYVARSLPTTSEQQGVAGYIVAGDFINVAATVETAWFGQSPSKVVTRTVFTNLHVIRVGTLQEPKLGTGATQAVPHSITVVMTECDAEAVDWLIGSGARLSFFLLSYKDYGSQPTAPDPTCPSPTANNGPIGPSEIDTRFGFTKA